MNTTSLATALLCVVAMFASGLARAQSSDDWKFQAVVYGYFPSIDSKTTFPDSGDAGVTVDASKFFENLEFVFMGSFEASKGQWGVYADVIYLDVGDSNSPSRDILLGGNLLPAAVSANIHYGLEAWEWTLAGLWHALSTPVSKLDVIGGVRVLELDQTVDWALSGNIGSLPLRDRAGTANAQVTNYDAIVGVKGRVGFGDGDWFAPYYVDIGAGDSQFTWQAMVGVGYAFGWGDVLAAWRYIDYDMKSGKQIESASLNGPAIAVAFRW